MNLAAGCIRYASPHKSKGTGVSDGRQARHWRSGMNNPQSFDEEAGQPDRDECEQYGDIRRTARETTAALPAPDEKHNAASDQSDTGNIHDEFIDTEIHAFMKHRVVRLAAERSGEQVF